MGLKCMPSVSKLYNISKCKIHSSVFGEPSALISDLAVERNEAVQLLPALRQLTKYWLPASAGTPPSWQ